MSIELTQAEHRFAVTGEEPLHEALSPDNPLFLPDLAVVLVSPGYPTVAYISGPRLDARGKAMKVRRGQTSWDHDELDNPNSPAPQWVRELMGRILSQVSA